MTNILRKSRKIGRTGSIALCLLALLAACPPATQACEDPPVQVILTVIKPPTGYMRINGQLYLSCSLTFDINTDLNIEAIKSFPDPPTPDYTFLNWAPNFVFGEPNFLGCGNPLYHTLTTNATVQPYFDDDPRFVDANLEAMIRFLVGSTSGNLTTAQLATLTSLTLVNNDITDLTGLELCTALTTLFIAENPITDFDALASLVNLTDLRIISCGMVDVSPLEELVGLNTLVLTDNDIEDLSPLLDNSGLGAGDFINIEENPLSLEALYLQAYELEKRGASVVATGGENLDGDVFSNAEELRYVQYYFNDPEFVNDLYHYYLTSDTLPGIGRACFENLDTVAVTVEVEGEGSVYVGDGYATEGNPKSWDFARYAAGCPTLCTAPAGCAANTITLTATPEADWAFWRWIGGAFGEASSTELEVEMLDDMGATAEFLYRPGMAELDLIRDLDTFLLDIGYIGESMAPGLYEYDTGKTEWVPDGLGGSTLELRPNGIPDAVELSLLQYLLQHVQFDMVWRGGASHIHTWRSWEVNLALAVSHINDTQLDYLARLVAAYMTLGTPGHRAAMVKLLDEHYGISLNATVYDTSVTGWFDPYGDLDGDGVWNIEEWENVEEALDGTGTPDEILDETTSGATDPDDAYKPLPPAPGTFVYNGNVIIVGSTEHLALIAEATGANGPLAKGTVTFHSSGGDLTMEAFVINPSGFGSVPMKIDEAFACALGREFRVTVKGDTRWFETWSAANTLIDGSPAKSETFILGNPSQSVEPGRRGEGTVILAGNYLEWVGAGPLADAIWTSQYQDTTILHVADGTNVRVRRADAAPPPPGTNAWGLKVDGDMSYRPILTVRPGGCSVELSTFYAGSKIWTHTLIGDGGVRVFGLQSNPSGDIQGYIVGSVDDLGPLPGATEFEQDYVAEFDVQPGYQLETISLPGEGTQCVGDIESFLFAQGTTAQATLATGAGGTRATTATKSTLTVEPMLMGNSGASVPDAGHFIGRVKSTGGGWGGLHKYFPRVTDCTEDTKLIELTAVPHEGYFFVRWTGEGQHFSDENKAAGVGALDAPDAPGTNWVISPTIYIECGYDRTLQPVFKQCTHCGTVHDGSLRGDTALQSYSGYYTYSENRYGCKHYIHKTIHDIGQEWYYYHFFCRPPIGIGQISKAGGGDSTSSSSHENGLDVDVRYLRNDMMAAPLDIASQPSLYDAVATQDLVNYFLGSGATNIFVDIDKAQLLPDPRVSDAVGHTNHFHVRFPKPTGETNPCGVCPTGQCQ